MLVSLLSEPGRRPWLRQLVYESGSSMSFVRRELAELERMGLVRSKRTGRGFLFEAQPCHPLYRPLLDLIRAAARVDAGEGPRKLTYRMPYEVRPPGEESWPWGGGAR